MKSTLPALVVMLSLAFTTSAWDLDLYTPDGRHTHMYGRVNSGCVNIDFTPILNVNHAKYNPDTPHWPDVTDTFELFVEQNCNGLSYRNGEGDFELTPREIRSYQVY
ncbi:MAG: hypothetical protein M1840_004341 [Geoglossum simile]|nr:MAG: hypothetical protein M1840_004341 [Geoglossum simile]